jgi:endonuclease-3 related protein
MNLTPSILYKILQNNYDKLNWWPIDHNYHKKNKTDPRFEIIIGTILTQNTSWSNVEKVLENLKNKNMLDLNKIINTDIESIKTLMIPSGFFNQKSKRLKQLSDHIFKNYNGDLNKFFCKDLNELRNELLSLNGIGPETADSILLYAGNYPIFVVDAYTKRLCERLSFNINIEYYDIQKYFQTELKKTYKSEKLTQVYNELHALIVHFAKDYCKKKPNCKKCPLNKFCKYRRKVSQ